MYHKRYERLISDLYIKCQTLIVFNLLNAFLHYTYAIFPSFFRMEPNSTVQHNQNSSLTYDYVIVGGGTAGLVLASRLTEDPAISVAVLEAGENRLNVRGPGLCSNTSKNPGRTPR